MKMVALRLFNLCLVDSNAHRIVLSSIMPKRDGNSIKVLEISCSYFIFLISRPIA